MAVSVTDLRRSNRLGRRRHANIGRTRLWSRCAPGNGGGLLIGDLPRRKSAEAVANLRHDHPRVAATPRVADLAKLYSCGNGEHRRLLEAEPAVTGGLDPAFVGAVTPADETVAVVVVEALALSEFADVSLLPTAQRNYPARDTRSASGHRCRSSSNFLMDS
jgi:hypothetical protein